MKKTSTIVNFILDKSGSMSSVREATISGFNEYIGTLKKDAKADYEFTLTLFDTKITRPFIGENIKAVDELTATEYNPDGNTALYDAVCSTIRGVKEKKGQKVITIIMTDGQENASKEYTEKDMKALITEREAQGNWKFVYLGANQDSYAVAQKYGISHGAISNFNATKRGIGASMATMATATVNYAQVVDNTADFLSQSQQDNLNSTK